MFTRSATDVRLYTELIARLAKIDQELHRPPVCRLWWGRFDVFQGVLTDLGQNYTMFLEDGTPVRATLSCTFLEVIPQARVRANELHSADVAADPPCHPHRHAARDRGAGVRRPGALAGDRPGQPARRTRGSCAPATSSSSPGCGTGDGVTRSAGDLPELRHPDQRHGTAAAGPGQDVRAVTVQESVGELAWFTVELSNWDDEKLQVSHSDGSLFAVGGAIEISLGYVDSLNKVLQANITSLEPVFTSGAPPVLTVGGYGYAHRLARGRRTRSFVKMKDSAIVAQVAREAGLRADVKDTGVALPYVAQGNQTDWAFLRERAARIGHEVFVRDQVLHFRPPATGTPAKQTLDLADDVTEFRPRLSAVGQVGEVTVRGWDVVRKAAVVGKAAHGAGVQRDGGEEHRAEDSPTRRSGRRPRPAWTSRPERRRTRTRSHSGT